MEPQQHHSTGNARLDGSLLLLIGFGSILSKITLSTTVSVLTGIGALLYIVNQAILLRKNLKK